MAGEGYMEGLDGYERLIAAVLRSYWEPAYRLLNLGKRVGMGKAKNGSIDEIGNYENQYAWIKKLKQIIEDLREVKELKGGFVVWCMLGGLEPEVVREKVEKALGGLDEALERIKKIHREAVGKYWEEE